MTKQDRDTIIALKNKAMTITSTDVPITQLAKEFTISESSIKDIIKMFYQIQDGRKAAFNQAHAEIQTQVLSGVPEEEVVLPIVSFVTASSLKRTEDAIGLFIKSYIAKNSSSPVVKWLLSIKGIGPMFAAGLLSYIDISKCQTAGAIHRYGGVTGDPEWDQRVRGKRIGYNPAFKTLLWKIGESFIKVSNPKDPTDPSYFYGVLYRTKLHEYIDKNDAGEYSDTAAEILSSKKFGEDTTAYREYKNGKLPMAHLVSRARRYAVKRFLDHLFQVWYEDYNKRAIPVPYIVTKMGHVHIDYPPLWKSQYIEEYNAKLNEVTNELLKSNGG